MGRPDDNNKSKYLPSANAGSSTILTTQCRFTYMMPTIILWYSTTTDYPYFTDKETETQTKWIRGWGLDSDSNSESLTLKSTWPLSTVLISVTWVTKPDRVKDKHCRSWSQLISNREGSGTQNKQTRKEACAVLRLFHPAYTTQAKYWGTVDGFGEREREAVTR